ncbi:Hypothetical predicted protein [Mytilus galloprovincialis]|uniref:EGF-like domain-containing protein n=1 Tax=Mytilus galloprovincialis TaxID=29158 RepID=A0A8B6BK89_MYTGA|nr:Hypothetical predicted protein [Mytilus galloprovincialis]VDH91404.1 Hypothetical predicted protein [Mytilus galloprovincialis]
MSIPEGMRCYNTHSCLHGGTLIMPRSIFGYCRCFCPLNWGGPMCELNRHRESPNLRRVHIVKRKTMVMRRRHRRSEGDAISSSPSPPYMRTT